MLAHARKYAYLSIGASILTMALKFGAFFLTDSVGLFSDAVESVVNLTAGVIALLAIILAYQPADHSHAYGHGKVEYFSSGAEGLLICLAALGISYASVRWFFEPAPHRIPGHGHTCGDGGGGRQFGVARIMLGVGRPRVRQHSARSRRQASADRCLDLGRSGDRLGGHAFCASILADSGPDSGVAMSVNILWTGIGLMRRSVAGLMDEGLPAEEILKLRARSLASVAPRPNFTPCVHANRVRPDSWIFTFSCPEP